MDNKKEKSIENSPALKRLDGVDKDIFAFFSYLLDIYNHGMFNSLINFIKSDGRILLLLVNSGGLCHPSDISSELNLSRPNVAANLRNMEKEGFITRETDKTNRRQVFVKITPAGLEKYKKETDAIVEVFTMWLKSLRPSEGMHLMSILKKTDEIAKQYEPPKVEEDKIEDIWKLS